MQVMLLLKLEVFDTKLVGCVVSWGLHFDYDFKYSLELFCIFLQSYSMNAWEGCIHKNAQKC